MGRLSFLPMQERSDRVRFASSWSRRRAVRTRLRVRATRVAGVRPSHASSRIAYLSTSKYSDRAGQLTTDAEGGLGEGQGGLRPRMDLRRRERSLPRPRHLSRPRGGVDHVRRGTRPPRGSASPQSTSGRPIPHALHCILADRLSVRPGDSQLRYQKQCGPIFHAGGKGRWNQRHARPRRLVLAIEQVHEHAPSVVRSARSQRARRVGNQGAQSLFFVPRCEVLEGSTERYQAAVEI